MFRFPILERIPDENAPEGYLEQVPAGVATWTYRWMLAETLTTAPTIAKSGMNPDAGGILIVPILSANYPLAMAAGIYQHALVRSDTAEARVASFGPAFLHPRVAVAV